MEELETVLDKLEAPEEVSQILQNWRAELYSEKV